MATCLSNKKVLVMIRAFDSTTRDDEPYACRAMIDSEKSYLLHNFTYQTHFHIRHNLNFHC